MANDPTAYGLRAEPVIDKTHSQNEVRAHGLQIRYGECEMQVKLYCLYFCFFFNNLPSLFLFR